MIYNEEFVWLHFPKCAGSKVEQLFSHYLSEQEEIIQDETDYHIDPSIAWHDSIYIRQKRDPDFKLGKRTVICSIRKLPSWLISRYEFEFHRSPNLPHIPEKLLEGIFLEENGNETHADLYMETYLPEIILSSGKVTFLRTEFFESDFKTIFGSFLDISSIPDYEFKRKVNVSKSNLSLDIKEKIQSNEKVYENCPYWRHVEELAY